MSEVNRGPSDPNIQDRVPEDATDDSKQDRMSRFGKKVLAVLMRAEQLLISPDTAAIAEHMEQNRREPQDWMIDVGPSDITPRIPGDDL